MMAAWQSYKLGSLIIENPKSKLKVRDSGFNNKYPFFTSGTTVNSHDDFLCSGDNIFIATGGKAFLQYYSGKASYSTDCYSITTNDKVATKLLFYFLESILFLINEEMFEGAALRHLQKSKLKDITIKLPDLPDQFRILNILDQAFDGIAKARANAEQNLQNTQNIYMSVLDQLFSDLSNYAKPSELRDFVDVLTDYHANGSYETLKQHVELKESEDYAWMVRSTDFENNFENDKRYIDKHAYDYLTKSCIFGGEIIMSKIGNAGKVYLMPVITRPCSLAMNLFLIRLNAKLSSKFAYYFLKTSNGTNQIKSRLQGAATQTITKENVRNLLIPVCSKEQQTEIVSKIESLSIETQRLEALYLRKIACLDELRKSLLQQAFAGEL